MSSRAASARKRINRGEETKEKKPASKGFFSRSKNPPQDKPIIDAPPSSFRTSKADGPVISNNDTNVNTPPPKSKQSAQHTSNLASIGDAPYSTRRTPGSKPVAPLSSSGSGIDSGYPSPPHEDRYQSHTVRLRANGRDHQTHNYQQVDASYIEASYQPPPPIIATYQPQPQPTYPGHSRRPLPILPGESSRTGQSDYDELAYSTPPIFPRSGSPASLSRRVPPRELSITATSSRSQSPTPSYHSTLPVPMRPPLQVSTDNSHLFSDNNAGGNNMFAYPSPPSPNPARNTPPLRIFRQQPDDSPSLLVEVERPWNRAGSASNLSVPSSPNISAARLSPAPAASPSPRLRSPMSLTESEDSGRSQDSTQAKPAFVYPGSRSVAKPKVSKKKANTVIGTDTKSRARATSDAAGSSRSGPQASSPVSPDHRLHTPISPPLSGGLLPIISTPTKRSSGTSSTFSDDSNDASHVRRNPTGTSAPGQPTPSVDSSETPTTYVFPTSRSRARPSKKPPSLNSKAGSDGKGAKDGERKRFMGILLSKKKSRDTGTYSSGDSNPRSSASDPVGRESDSPDSRLPDIGSNLSDATLAYEESQVPIQRESRERAMKIKSRIGSYPLDPYDSVLLDNDRHTGELLSRLNPTGSPTFYDYGNSPPVSILDLGCGQGHWVIDAAIAWKGYGTKVTGYDMVDISRGLFPWAAQQGVVKNIRFVRGNFLKQRLPFNDESFDLVRMSCLGLCVTTDSWVFLLQEVNRVLMLGGRLEIIDDEVFFPYGRNSALPTVNQRYSIAPQLDITIPSPSFNTYSIYDGETTNPGLGMPIEEAEATDFFELYGVDEEPEVDDDTATIHGVNMSSSDVSVSSSSRRIPRSRGALGYHGISSRSWMRAYDTSKDIESLFEHMLVHKFGTSIHPNEFILDILQEVFGHAREINTMHITLAPSDCGQEDDKRGRQPGGNVNGRNGYSQQHRSPSSSRRHSIGLSQSPGIILWPSTFIPMSQPEIEIHASKHLRMLLSCKNYLIEHAIEATDDEDIDEESVLEALWEYEGFLRHRFNLPPPASASTSEYSHHRNDDSMSDRISIAESVTMDSLEAMLEIQSEFRQHFGWPRSPSQDAPDSPGTIQSQDDVALDPDFPSTAPSSSNVRSRSSSRDAHNNLSGNNLTHVRTFRVYEAIKVDEGLFGGGAF